MLLVKNGTKYASVYVAENASSTLFTAAQDFVQAVAAITGVTLAIQTAQSFTGKEHGVVLSTFSQLGELLQSFEKEQTACNEEGFCVVEKGDTVFVLSSSERGVYFGAHDLLEKNAQVVWARGANEERLAVIEQDELRLDRVNYTENSPFTVRAWNLCGYGTEGEQHADDGTAAYLGANKSNATAHRFIKEWKKYGLFGSGVVLEGISNIDYLANEHPEWFMTAPDGGVMPALHGWDSFLNYYNKDVAKAFAKLLVDSVEKIGEGNLGHWNMPDNPYFCMVENGVKLHEQPFTADEGTTVYPEDKNYKSTVYFNFLNRVMQEANALRPNTYLHVFAYTYSEETPAIDVDERLVITLAPIQTNDKYAYTDTRSHDNDGIRDNLIRWSQKTNNLELYMYWSSFRGTTYSRPILKVIQENLLWFESLGIKRVQIEGKVDCSLLENPTPAQANSVKFYDMNEAYTWAMHKLMWNPRQDIDELLTRFCKIVYKECAKETAEYFRLLQKGWDEKDALVWYTTGGDVYYLQFVLNAGVADGITAALTKAKAKATTLSVKRKVDVLYETTLAEIDKYKNFVKEDAEVLYTDIGEDKLLSKEQMDYIHNAASEWNRAKSLTVLRDYSTMEYYPKEAKFSCKMLFDKKNIYVGYTIFDDRLVEEKEINGVKRYYREDGSELVSYPETYIGGNVFNQDTYYGFISGFMGERKDQWYENKGSPKGQPIPQGVRDVKYVHLADEKEKRYYFHVQVIPYEALGVAADSCNPYGSFVYYTNRFGRAGWMGYGLWSKQNFSAFPLIKKEKNERR